MSQFPTIGGLCWCRQPLGHSGPCQMFAGQKPPGGQIENNPSFPDPRDETIRKLSEDLAAAVEAKKKAERERDAALTGVIGSEARDIVRLMDEVTNESRALSAPAEQPVYEFGTVNTKDGFVVIRRIQGIAPGPWEYLDGRKTNSGPDYYVTPPDKVKLTPEEALKSRVAAEQPTKDSL